MPRRSPSACAGTSLCRRASLFPHHHIRVHLWSLVFTAFPPATQCATRTAPLAVGAPIRALASCSHRLSSLEDVIEADVPLPHRELLATRSRARDARFAGEGSSTSRREQYVRVILLVVVADHLAIRCHIDLRRLQSPGSCQRTQRIEPLARQAEVQPLVLVLDDENRWKRRWQIPEREEREHVGTDQIREAAAPACPALPPEEARKSSDADSSGDRHAADLEVPLPARSGQVDWPQTQPGSLLVRQECEEGFGEDLQPPVADRARRIERDHGRTGTSTWDRAAGDRLVGSQGDVQSTRRTLVVTKHGCGVVDGKSPRRDDPDDVRPQVSLLQPGARRGPIVLEVRFTVTELLAQSDTEAFLRLLERFAGSGDGGPNVEHDREAALRSRPGAKVNAALHARELHHADRRWRALAKDGWEGATVHGWEDSGAFQGGPRDCAGRTPRTAKDTRES